MKKLITIFLLLSSLMVKGQTIKWHRDTTHAVAINKTDKFGNQTLLWYYPDKSKPGVIEYNGEHFFPTTAIADTVKCYFLRLDPEQNPNQAFVGGYGYTPEQMSLIIQPKWFTGYICKKFTDYGHLEQPIFLYSDRKTKVKEMVINYFINP